MWPQITKTVQEFSTVSLDFTSLPFFHTAPQLRGHVCTVRQLNAFSNAAASTVRMASPDGTLIPWVTVAWKWRLQLGPYAQDTCTGPWQTWLLFFVLFPFPSSFFIIIVRFFSFFLVFSSSSSFFLFASPPPPSSSSSPPPSPSSSPPPPLLLLLLLLPRRKSRKLTCGTYQGTFNLALFDLACTVSIITRANVMKTKGNYILNISGTARNCIHRHGRRTAGNVPLFTWRLSLPSSLI